MNELRYCRICWNTEDWQHPTGEAAKLETLSYISEHGFGHEEWLLKQDWIIDGYKYRYLQPLHSISLRSKAKAFDIILYTIAPTKKRFFVGRITNCELVTHEDAVKVLKVYTQQGWLNEMIQHLKILNVDPYPIATIAVEDPIWITNFRFKPENVELLRPFVPVSESHKVYRINRYRPLVGNDSQEWNSIIRKKKEHPGNEIDFRHGKLKPTETRNRAAQEGVAFDPTHDRMQNKLFKKLTDLYGELNVGYEDNAVDIVVRHGSQITYYEIKTSTTAKHCIRLAVGQLLEYAHWVDCERAQRLIVVGPVLSGEDAIAYLNHIRGRYGLPIYYCHFDLSSGNLSPPY
jgi:hypothetical protein